jgi:hypothetical protein
MSPPPSIINVMKTKNIPYTVDELATVLYEENESHFEFINNMNGGDCDCAVHLTMNTIADIMEWPKEMD